MQETVELVLKEQEKQFEVEMDTELSSFWKSENDDDGVEPFSRSLLDDSLAVPVHYELPQPLTSDNFKDSVTLSQEFQTIRLYRFEKSCFSNNIAEKLFVERLIWLVNIEIILLRQSSVFSVVSEIATLCNALFLPGGVHFYLYHIHWHSEQLRKYTRARFYKRKLRKVLYVVVMRSASEGSRSLSCSLKLFVAYK